MEGTGEEMNKKPFGEKRGCGVGTMIPPYAASLYFRKHSCKELFKNRQRDAIGVQMAYMEANRAARARLEYPSDKRLAEMRPIFPNSHWSYE